MQRNAIAVLVFVAWWSWTAWALPNEISYEIQARLETKEHKLYGTERILFTSKADTPLKELYLHLWPNRFAEGSVQAREMGINSFDAMFPNGPDYGYLFVEELKLDGKDVKYAVDDTILKIEPEMPIAPDQAVEISIRFIVKIPNALERLGHDKGNYYISWWYPKMSVYDARGWHPDVAHAFGAGEPYEDFAGYAVELTVPSKMIVGSTGQLRSESENKDGTKTLVYMAEDVHDFAWVADTRYQSETTQWEHVKIISLYWPEDETAGKRAAQYAKDALEYFSKRFGRYPYPNFTVAEIGGFGFAMEYPQIIQQSYNAYRLPEFVNILDVMTAHETAHQWFYGMMMNNQLEETWLDEGFATFAEIAYIEQKYGKVGNLLNADWLQKHGLGLIWELAKDSIGDDRTNVIESYARIAREGREAPLITPLHRVPSGKTVLPYQKGALMLLALENLVGTEVFDRVMQEYYRRYHYKRVTPEDFIETAGEVSERDLEEFFEQWLASTKALDYTLEGIFTQKIEDKYITRVMVRQGGQMRMPADIEVTLRDEKVKLRQRWEALDDQGTLAFITDEPIHSVVIDPDMGLPDINRSDNASLNGFEALGVSLWVDHGMLRGHPEDGLTLGGQWKSYKMGYSWGLNRTVWEWSPTGSFCFADRCTSGWRLTFRDDGHVLAHEADSDLRWFCNTPQLSRHRTLSVGFFQNERYNVGEDEGWLRGLRVGYALALRRKDGTDIAFSSSYKAGLGLLSSDYVFNTVSVELRVQKRLVWQMPLIRRFFWGWTDGYDPLVKGFDLQRDGSFRGFSGRVDHIAALGMELRHPIPGFNKVDIGPIPLSFGVTAFANIGRVMPSHLALRADAGLGVTLGILGSPIAHLEYTLWTNTYENNARRGWSVRFERSFSFAGF